MGFLSLCFWVFTAFFPSSFVSADTYALAKYDPQEDSKDFSLLQSVIQDPAITSPDHFLIAWKKQKPAYFSNYVLSYRSRSLQKSSASHPRALIFNKNADLVISFNGHKDHKGFKNLELMHFNHDTKSFEFVELTFPEGKAQLSEVNPKKCLACHQSASRTNVDPRPNWEPYNTWLGFYGSLDDSTELFRDSFIREFKPDPVLDAVLLNEITNETQWLSDFRAYVQPNHKRYSLLTGATTDQYGKADSTLNGDLTNRLAVLNFKRVARLIRTSKSEIYQFAKWPIWAHANCGMTRYIKDDVYNWLYEQVPNKDNSRKNEQASLLPTPPPRYSEKFMDSEKFNPYVPEFFSANATDMINILFESVGVSTEDWSMDFKTDGARFAAFERFGVTNDPRPPWMEAIKNELNKDPELANATCDDAKAKTIERFANLEKVKTQVQALRAQNPPQQLRPLLDRCTNCHSSDARNTRMDTPIIPFNNPEHLKVFLQKTGYKRGTLLNEIRFRIGPHATEDEQMPKGGVPTTQQKEELLNYLESL